ncbi:MAG: hypothetical protein COV44_07825 [Deltaproteobacteria bacterium CG11_big_fil_rev_8_21_14_0_20_45_16]|nr:MAG: hypothetical protein COV44_07825 [Deltaproteobacteria bacterium CG11_big_fil_rev_8_21_14_0_20_45_16]
MPSRRSHLYRTRVEFEDVDSGGVLHHPKYLNFYERARVSFLRERGVSFKNMIDSGYALAVREMQVSYMKPLFFEDEVTILTRVVEIRAASLRLTQAMFQGVVLEGDRGLAENDWGELDAKNQMNLFLVHISLQRMAPVRFSENQCAALGS